MRSAANRQLISPAFTMSSSRTRILRRLRAARQRILRLSMSESPRRGAHFRGAMAASEVWSVRRAKEAGEALRPSRTKPCATSPSDRPRPSPRGAPTPSATTTTTGSSGAPIGTVVGLVVAREQILFSDPKQFDRLLNATVLRRFLTRPRYDKYLVQDHRLEDERAHRHGYWNE